MDEQIIENVPNGIADIKITTPKKLNGEVPSEGHVFYAYKYRLNVGEVSGVIQLTKAYVDRVGAKRAKEYVKETYIDIHG